MKRKNTMVQGLPYVRMERYESEPDEVNGAVCRGLSFRAGAGADTVEVYIPAGAKGAHDVPELFIGNADAIPLDRALRLLPALVATLTDPRVQRLLEQPQEPAQLLAQRELAAVWAARWPCLEEA